MDTLENHNRNQFLDSTNTQGSRLRKMWCHVCKFEFSTLNLTSFECEKCKNDFCEEIEPSIEQTDDPRQFIPFGEEQTQVNNQQQNQRPAQQVQNQNTQNLQQNSPIRNTTQSRVNINRGQQMGQQPGRLSYSISIQSTQQDNPFFGINSLISNLFPVTAQRTGMMNDNNFDNIIDFLMRNDPNVYGTPPAAETSINSLPVVTFSKEQMKEESLCECSVCKEEFTEGEQLQKMPCNHLFHSNCILTWLKMHNSCPTCRHELPTDNQDYERRKQQKLERANQQNQNRRN